ncbi:MAG UNVERIFIED_CONTAM: hypothetical protein LVR29_10210 [Microcystis novacekii LVE1205-3]
MPTLWRSPPSGATDHELGAMFRLVLTGNAVVWLWEILVIIFPFPERKTPLD